MRAGLSTGPKQVSARLNAPKNNKTHRVGKRLHLPIIADFMLPSLHIHLDDRQDGTRRIRQFALRARKLLRHSADPKGRNTSEWIAGEKAEEGCVSYVGWARV